MEQVELEESFHCSFVTVLLCFVFGVIIYFVDDKYEGCPLLQYFTIFPIDYVTSKHLITRAGCWFLKVGKH